MAVSHIAGQPINSTEQEVIGLLLAQQQVFTSPTKLEPSSVSTNPGSIAMVTDDVLQQHGTENKGIVMVSMPTSFELYSYCLERKCGQFNLPQHIWDYHASRPCRFNRL